MIVTQAFQSNKTKNITDLIIIHNRSQCIIYETGQVISWKLVVKPEQYPKISTFETKSLILVTINTYNQKGDIQTYQLVIIKNDIILQK